MTAFKFSSIVYCLLAHPEVCKLLQAGVDALYPAGEDAAAPFPDSIPRRCDVRFPSYERHVYTADELNRSETMCLYPVAPSSTQRSLESGSGGFAAGPQ